MNQITHAYLTTEHPHAKILVSVLECQMSQGDTNDEVHH